MQWIGITRDQAVTQVARMLNCNPINPDSWPMDDINDLLADMDNAARMKLAEKIHRMAAIQVVRDEAQRLKLD